jgi:hypothetical protein
MRLFEHPDFDQAILAAAERFAMSPTLVEKDYYVTEALRIIGAVAGDKVIFKGGTSLSKGWNLIQRFSEDIDIFLDPLAFQPPLGKNGINRELKKLRDAIAKHPALTHLKDLSTTIGGFGRNDYFGYDQKFAGIANRILVEAGAASGREPTETIALSSLVAQFMNETNASVGADDEASFSMRLLHFRRTFVEKLFTIHGKIELYKSQGRPLGSYARHLYDLHQLAARAEVLAMLASEEYAAIKADYDAVSREHFPDSYSPPVRMSFATSDALFPTGELRDMIAREYEAQCRVLCYAPHPPWEEVEAVFLRLRERL